MSTTPLAALVLERTQLKHLCRWLDSVAAVVELCCSERGVLCARILTDYFVAELSLPTRATLASNGLPVRRAFLCARLAQAAHAFDKAVKSVRWLWFASGWEFVDANSAIYGPSPQRHFYVELEQPELRLRELPADSEIALRCMVAADAILAALPSDKPPKKPAAAAAEAAEKKPERKRRTIAEEPLQAVFSLEADRAKQTSSAFAAFFRQVSSSSSGGGGNSAAGDMVVLRVDAHEAARGSAQTRTHDPRWSGQHSSSAGQRSGARPPVRVEIALQQCLTATLGTNVTRTLLRFNKVAALLRLTMYRPELDERVILEFFDRTHNSRILHVQLAPLLQPTAVTVTSQPTAQYPMAGDGTR